MWQTEGELTQPRKKCIFLVLLMIAIRFIVINMSVSNTVISNQNSEELFLFCIQEYKKVCFWLPSVICINLMKTTIVPIGYFFDEQSQGEF